MIASDAERNRKGRGIECARAGKIRLPFAEHIARRMREPQAQKIADLACEDDDRDAGGETRDHGIGHIFDEGADARKPRRDQHHARHDGGDDQSVITEFLDDIEDDDDKRARRPADLKAAAAECRNDEARDHRGEEAALGCSTARNRQRHRQRQSHDRNRDSGEDIGAQIARAIALQHGADELWDEHMPLARAGRRWLAQISRYIHAYSLRTDV